MAASGGSVSGWAVWGSVSGRAALDGSGLVAASGGSGSSWAAARSTRQSYTFFFLSSHSSPNSRNCSEAPSVASVRPGGTETLKVLRTLVICSCVMGMMQ